MRAIQITEFGGPEVLHADRAARPGAGPGEPLIDVSHAGVNYADTHQSENSYLAPSSSSDGPGGEVVGRTADGRRVVALVTAGTRRRPSRFRRWPSTFPTRWTTRQPLPSSCRGRRRGCCCTGPSTWHRGSRSLCTRRRWRRSLAVQLAETAAAGRVIATASTAEKRQLALDLGADVAVDASGALFDGSAARANDGAGSTSCWR